MAKNSVSGERGKRDIIITRIFDAPRELVWKAWTDPKHFKIWWGPKDYTCPFCEMDLRVGGKYLNCMRSPEGKEYWTTGFYKEIIPFERIVYTDSFSDAEGNIVSATYYGMSPDFPLEALVTVTLEDFEGKTKMTLRHTDLPAGDMSEQTGEGWSESFDKLAASLK
jgi:uncharacterized protein YndB with AHSA1/START domain